MALKRVSVLERLKMSTYPRGVKACRKYLKKQWHEIFCFSFFFHESVSPQPQSIPLGPFWIFSKIRGDIRKLRCNTGINDTGGKFATSVNDTGGKLMLVSTTPAANLPPVYRWCTLTCEYLRKFLKKFKTVLMGYSGAGLELRISPRIFEKIRNGPNGTLRGLGETDSWKKPEVENLVTLSL
jgi:hypothetical protein